MGRQRATVEDADQGDQTDQMIESIHFGMESIKQLCQDLLPLGTKEQSAENVVKLRTKYKLLIKALIVHQESSRIVEQVSDEVDINGDEATESEVITACERIATLSKERVDTYANSITENDIITHRSYVEFMEVVTRHLRDDDDGGSTATEEMEQDEDDDDGEENDEDEQSGEDVEGPSKQHVPTIDPISKKLLTDPVKNKICGHFYSKARITLHMAQSKSLKVKCPIPGCKNEQLKKSQFLENEEITKAVKQEQARKAKAAKRGRRR